MKRSPMHPLKWPCIQDIDLWQTVRADPVPWVKLKWKIELQPRDHGGSQRLSTTQELPMDIPVLP